MIAPTLNELQKNYERNSSMTTENKNALAVIDGETLMDMRLPQTKFCVHTLLPQGVTILGGAPKIGKSWLVWISASVSPKENRCGICQHTEARRCIFASKTRSAGYRRGSTASPTRYRPTPFLLRQPEL